MAPGNGASENTVPGEGAVEVFSKASFAHRNFSAECYNLKWLGHQPREHWYIRVLVCCVGFACCFSDKKLFAVLYFVSFVCDGLDGWFAQKFNQVSTFGAVLDMVTNSLSSIQISGVSTACLLVILSHFYRPAVVFLSLLLLDVVSHWLQMYRKEIYWDVKRLFACMVLLLLPLFLSTFLAGKASHKGVKDGTNWLLKVLYIILFLLAGNEPESVISVLVNAVRRGSLLSFPAVLSLFGCAIKQAVNVIQMKTAADVCMLYNINRKEKQ